VAGNRLTPSGDAFDREFERFVLAESPGLLRSAYLLCGDHGHAEDLLQTALLRTLRRWDAITGSRRAYASEVLVNLARDRRRSLSRRPLESHAEPLVEPRLPDTGSRLAEREWIADAVRELPRAQQEVVACRFILELSVAETAAALQLPEGTVKSHTARALAALRDGLSAREAAGRRGDRGRSR
jgi:RNA polymerase sigma factor (sigma-70 family)